MKKLVLTGLVAVSVLNASSATLSCRQGGINYNSEVVMSMNCGSMGSSECENSFREELKRKYSTTNDYNAQEKACSQKSGGWYPDKIRVN